MYCPDVVALRHFYVSPLGRQAFTAISRQVSELWPSLGGDTMLGLGFATPYLERYAAEGSGLVMACMPAMQGAAYWPPSRPNLAFLSHEGDLPLPGNTINRVLLVHALEHSEELRWMMEEIWRVMTPGGRLLAVVPARLGLWARSARTPLGYGRPFSLAQLRHLLGESQFTVTRMASALYFPPSRLPWLLRCAGWLERAGQRCAPAFLGSVMLVEAEKQIYASVKEPAAQRLRYRIPAVIPRPAISRTVKIDTA